MRGGEGKGHGFEALDFQLYVVLLSAFSVSGKRCIFGLLQM